jgi:hypothetical protein
MNEQAKTKSREGMALCAVDASFQTRLNTEQSASVIDVHGKADTLKP